MSFQEHEAIQFGIQQMLRLLQELGGRKGIKQRSECMSSVTELFNKFRLYILNGEFEACMPRKSFLELSFKHCVEELDANETKSTSKRTASQDQCFNFFTSILSHLLEDYSSDVLDAIEVDFVAMFLHLIGHPFVTANAYMENTVASILKRYLAQVDIVEIPGDVVNELWNRCWLRFTESRASIYLDIGAQLLEVSQKTVLALEGGALVERLLKYLFKVLDKKNERWSQSIYVSVTNLLTIAISGFGIECREILVDRLSRFVLDFGEKTSVADVSDQNHLLYTSLWNYLELFFAMAVPDCLPCSLVKQELYDTAQQLLRILWKDLMQVSARDSNFVLSNEKACLFARLIAISEVSPCDYSGFDASMMNTSKLSVKRRKETTVLQMLCDWDFDECTVDIRVRPLLCVSSMKIVEVLVRRWHMRLGSVKLATITKSLWPHHLNLKDSQRPYFCNLLSTLVNYGGLSDVSLVKNSDSEFNSEQRIRAVWKFALSAANVVSSSAMAAKLILSILRTFKHVLLSILAEDEIVESLLNVFAKFHGPEIHPLLLYFLTELEFEENGPLPGYVDRSAGISNFRLRSHLCELLLRNVSSDVSDVLVQLSTTFPLRKYEDLGGFQDEICAGSDLVKRLDDDLSLLRHSNSTIPSRTTTLSSRERVPLIQGMVEYVTNLMLDLWHYADNRVEFWKSMCCFVHKCLDVDRSVSDILKPLCLTINEWLRRVALEEVPEFLSQLDIGAACVLLSDETLETLLSISSPIIFARFLHCDIVIPPNLFLPYVDETVRLCKIQDFPVQLDSEITLSSVLSKRVTAFETEFLPDILTLLQKCGKFLSQSAKDALILRARNLIENDEEFTDPRARTLAIKQLFEAELLSTSARHHRVKINDEVVAVISPVMIIRATPFASISSAAGMNLLHRSASGNCVLLGRLLAELLLLDYVQWTSHFEVLKWILRTPGMAEIFDETMPKFDELIHFHRFALAMSDCQPKSILTRCVDEACSSSVVQQAAQLDQLGAECFPDAFYLNNDYWVLVTESFWKNYSAHAHKLLTDLRFIIDSHCELGMELRLGHLLRALSLPEMSDKLRIPFVAVVRSILISLLKSCKNRDRHELIAEMLKVVLCVDEELQQQDSRFCPIKIFIADILGANICPISAELQEYIDLRINDLLEGKVFEWSVSIVTTDLFWNVFKEKLIADQGSRLKANDPSFIALLILLWDMLPDMRQSLSPFFMFISESNFPLLRRISAKGSMMDDLRRFCLLSLSDFRLNNRSQFYYSLVVLSCDMFGDYAVLWTLDTDSVIEHTQGSNRRPPELICQAGEELTSIARKLFEDDSPESFLLDFLKPFIKNVPLLAYCISPYLCSLDDVATSTSSWVIQFISENKQFKDHEAFADARLVRVLCECIDGIGLGSLARLNDCENAFIALGRLAVKFGFLEHAYALSNLAFDCIVRNDRDLLAVGGKESFTKNESLIELLRRIYVAQKDASALSSLPVWVQKNEESHLVRLASEKRWLDVQRNSSASDEEYALANWMCGLTNGSTSRSRSSEYMSAVLALNNDMSFPKRFSNYWERIFSLISHSEVNYILQIHAHSLWEKLSRAEEVDENVCSEMRDYTLIEEAMRLDVDFTKCDRRQLCILAALYHSVLSRSNGSSSYKDAYWQVISLLIEKLLIEKGYGACETIIGVAMKVFVEEEKLTDLRVKRCTIEAAKGDYELAMHHLTEIIEEAPPFIQLKCLVAQAQLSLQASQCVDSALPYLEKIQSMAEECHSLETRQTVFSLHFRQLQELESKKDSSANKTRRYAVMSWTRELENTQKMQQRRQYDDKDRRKYQIIQNELRCEKEHIRQMDEQLNNSAVSTVEAAFSYLGMICSDHEAKGLPWDDDLFTRTNRIIFPLIDVVFRYESVAGIVQNFKEYLRTSFCPAVWVPILPHVMAHSFRQSPIAPVIQDLAVQLIIAYPFHVVLTVLSYRFDHKGETKDAVLVDSLLRRAERRESNLSSVLDDLKAAHGFYRQFLWLPIKKDNVHPLFQKKGVKYVLSEEIGLVSGLSVLRRVPIPTVTQPLGKPGDYSREGLILWRNVDKECSRADGQSAPKILRVKGSNGVLYKTVWKDGESLRQDSLVQDLFRVMGDLISSDRSLRTYNVIPIDAMSGIIEFCSNTVPLKDLLIGADSRSGLHKEIYPLQDTYNIRMKMAENCKTRATPSIEEFKMLLKDCSPVFRHFFYQQFSSCEEWNRMIRCYTKSLAHWNIVCYIVGLGDRHCNNVLFETATCRFVHIDLGMIMEYSQRNLPMPERVPFRLTRDILDPILIQGTRGRLAKQMADSYSVLQEKKEVILGAASVFLRETIANHRDSTDDSKPSMISATAIGRLRDKLNALDFTCVPTSAENQISILLNEATDLRNLSRMFHGWLPFV